MAAKYLEKMIELRFPLVVDGLTHLHIVNGTPDVAASDPIIPGADPTAIFLNQEGGGSGAIATIAQTYITLLEPFYEAATALATCEAWYYNGTTSDATFINAFPVTFTGSNAGAYTPAQYYIWTFRTLTGRIKKTVFLEISTAGNGKTPLSSAAIGPSAEAYRDWCLGPDSFLADREGGFIVAGLFRSAGQNETVWRKRYRP